MKVNLYKIEQVQKSDEITYTKFVEKINKKGYVSKEKKTIHSIVFELYINRKQRSEIDWLEELYKVFDKNSDEINYGDIYNAIIIIRGIQNNIYALTFGHSYHAVQSSCDMNFAMDFAESELKAGDIDTKSSDYVQSIKIRELVNVKEDSVTTSIGGESYRFVAGKPSFDLYGKRIDCGFAIQFSKTFPIENAESLNDITNLIVNIERSLLKPKVNSFPRIRYLNKSNEQNEVLDAEFLENFNSNNNEIEVYTSTFNIIGSKILYNSAEYKYVLYCKNNKSNTQEEIEFLNQGNVVDYFNRYKNTINILDDVQVIIIKNGEERPSKSIKNFLFSILEFQEEKYILTNGRWGIVNEKFIDELERTLDFIDEHYVDLAPKEFSISYIDEDDYVDKLTKNVDFVKLHKNLIRVENSSFELADIFSSSQNELIAIKLGSSNQEFIYSFDQASSAVKCLLNAKDYQLSEQLSNYKIDNNVIKQILNKPRYSVILAFEQVTYKNQIKNGTFKLKNLKSLLLKLKIASWADFMTSCNIEYGLHIVIGN